MGGAGDGAPSWRFHGRGRAGRVSGPLPHVGVDQPGFRPARATLPMASTVRALAIVFAISQNQAISRESRGGRYLSQGPSSCGGLRL